MIALSAAVLGAFADAFVAALAEKVSGAAITKLRGDPAQCALKQALGAAIRRYSVPSTTAGFRLELAHPLLEADGFLMQPKVIDEITHIVRFDREPDYAYIGQQWAAALADPQPEWRDFTDAAKQLVGYLRDELRETDTFRPVFDHKELGRVAANTAAAAESLAAIETHLAVLNELANSRFGALLHEFARARVSVRDEIRDYTWYIDEKTEGFVGRAFVFDAIDRFVGNNPRGYYFVRGDPGIGKTALTAQLVKTRGYVHHFNIRAMGINKADLFLRNVYAQLIAAYRLDRASIPERVDRDGGFLSTLLSEVARTLKQGEKAVIVIDGLDEVDDVDRTPGSNALYLPVTLPRGVYIIATTRKVPLPPGIECEQGTLDIEHNADGNVADIRAYVARAAMGPGIQAFIASQGIDVELFIEHLVEKSEGNFMYLRYVLPEIERGTYADRGLAALPQGLRNYYEQHWRRMRGEDAEVWLSYKLPIMMALVAAELPISVDLISDFSGVWDRRRVLAMLQPERWGQFLHKEAVPHEGTAQWRYSLYHASFKDFLGDKDEVEDGVSIISAKRKITASYRSKLFGHG